MKSKECQQEERKGETGLEERQRKNRKRIEETLSGKGDKNKARGRHCSAAAWGRAWGTARDGGSS